MSPSPSPKLDVVYILGSGSRWSDNEIRYSLRSIEKHLPHANVYVVGNERSWMRNIKVIESPDPFGPEVKARKAKNAMWKVKLAAQTLHVSDEFILMNDDFFFLKDVEHIEQFYSGTLTDRINSLKDQSGDYKMALSNTRYLMKEFVEYPKNFAVHYPMRIQKKRFIKMADSLDWTINPYLFRSVYGNLYHFDDSVERGPDPKIFTVKDLRRFEDSDFISTSDDIVLSLQFQTFIAERFPNLSKYESK